MKKKIIITICYFFLSLTLLFASGKNTGHTIYGVSLTSADKPQLWKRLPVNICIHNSIPQNFHNDILEAMEAWNKKFEKKIFISNCKSKGTIEAGGLGQNNIYFIRQEFDRYTAKTSVARTIRSFDEDTGEIVDADIVVNAEHFDWNRKNLDLKTVLIHELGHALSLQHNFLSIKSPMNYFPYQSGYKIHEISEDEITIINHFYFNNKKKISEYLHKFLNNDYNSAIAVMKSIKNPSAKIFYGLGYLYKLKKDYTNSVKYMKLAFEKNKENIFALYHIGDCYWMLTNNKKAYEYFSKVLKQNNNYYEAIVNLAALELDKGKIKTAKKLFERTLKIIPVHYVACYHLANITNEEKYNDCYKKYKPDSSSKSNKGVIYTNYEVNCSWCVTGNEDVKNEIIALSKLPPTKILSALESKGVCVLIFKTDRIMPKGVFHWGKVRKGEDKITSLSKIKNIMGKTLCKGELPISNNCTTIVLASDAPKSTLIHEYLHVKQISRDKKWCNISKKMWANKQITQSELLEIRNKEWDVRKFLWKHLNKLNFSLEDKINVLSGIVEEKNLRKSFDSKAEEFVKKNKISSSLNKYIEEYKSQLRIKEKPVTH